jgi:hypothetical protein
VAFLVLKLSHYYMAVRMRAWLAINFHHDYMDVCMRALQFKVLPIAAF